MPTRTISFSSRAYSLRLGGTKTLPCRSTGHSAAPDMIRRRNAFICSSTSEREAALFSMDRHSSKGYATRQRRRLVITRRSSCCAFSTSRNRAGIIRRPLSSRLCVDRPRNKLLFPQKSSSLHFTPPSTPFRHYMDGT